MALMEMAVSNVCRRESVKYYYEYSILYITLSRELVIYILYQSSNMVYMTNRIIQKKDSQKFNYHNFISIPECYITWYIMYYIILMCCHVII